MTSTANRPGQRPDAYDDDGVFDLNAAAAEARHDNWHFRYGPDDDVWQLAPILDLDYRMIEAADEGQLDAVRTVIADRMEAAEKGQWARFDKLDLPIGVLNKLFEEWLRVNGLQPGESARSSRNSGATGTRSRQRAPRKAGR